ncbi:MAG: MFS transporter, partial [Bacteroidales bacterium]|nr:MFS transporter [Bacteroidales bacterium]
EHQAPDAGGAPELIARDADEDLVPIPLPPVPAGQPVAARLAPHTQRGTANSSVLISWDIGVGLGILAGGVISENVGYHWAFWTAWIVNLVGVIAFFAYVRQSFLKNKLR